MWFIIIGSGIIFMLFGIVIELRVMLKVLLGFGVLLGDFVVIDYVICVLLDWFIWWSNLKKKNYKNNF